MDKHQKKQIKRYIIFGCAALLVALLAALPLLASRNVQEDGPQASILNTRLEQRTIDTQIIGGGQLASEAAEAVTIPEAVKLTKYLVGNGDTVKKGDAIARVDKVSVMLAISEVQETLDYLSDQIASAASQTESNKLTAQAAGVVKVIYGKAGDNVRDVMLEHGALAVVSLDDKMAVDIACSTDLTYGNAVIVTLASGKQVKGSVKSNILGTLTVTMEDKDYGIGETVTVSTTDGEELGSGELYIHNPWNASAYYGSIKKVNVKVGDKVTAGKQLFQLEVGDHSATFQILANQRQEYEEMMQELFQMYSTGVLAAPCDGFVTGVDTNGTFLLAAEAGAQSWYVQPLSSTTQGSGWTVTLLSNNSAEGSSPGDDIPDESTPIIPDCTKTPDCQGQVHDFGCPKAVYTVRVAQVLPTGNVATNPETYSNVNDLSAVPKTVALGGNVENWPTVGLLNLDLTTYHEGIAGEGSILFELSDVKGNKYYLYAGSASSGGQMGNMPGGMPGGSFGGGGFGGGGTTTTFEPYSLETITVASVTTQEEMTLEISVDEQDIARLHMGQDATVTVEALTGQTFPAVITSISNTGTNEGGSSKFTVKLTLSKSGDMLPGMNASAYLPLQSQSAVTIPVAALVEDGTKTLVYTGYDEKNAVLTNPVTVTTGVSDGEYVQILSGLSESDTVYYAYYDTAEQTTTFPQPDFGF